MAGSPACAGRWRWTRQAIVDEVTASGLRGRGGAGFPTGIKWDTVAARPGAAEVRRLQRRRGRQRHLRRPDDHGGRSLRADRGHGDRRRSRSGRPRATSTSARSIPTPSRRCSARDRRSRARRACSGASVLGSGPGLRHGGARRRRGLCLRRGDEPAELARGQAGVVRAKPPLPAIAGLFGRPTVVNNVISLATVPVILEKGAALLPGLRPRAVARHDPVPDRRQRAPRRAVRDRLRHDASASSSRRSAAAPPRGGR